MSLMCFFPLGGSQQDMSEDDEIVSYAKLGTSHKVCFKLQRRGFKQTPLLGRGPFPSTALLHNQ